MSANYLLKYSQELATGIEDLCKSLNDRRGNLNTLFQLKKSSSSVFANISEAQYPQSLPDMLSKFEIARKECMETESWLKLLLSSSDNCSHTIRIWSVYESASYSIPLTGIA